jgi:hypothetical protein
MPIRQVNAIAQAVSVLVRIVRRDSNAKRGRLPWLGMRGARR